MGEDVEVLVFTWTTDWCGDATVKPSTRRDRADYFRKLRSLSVSEMLLIVYKFIVESVISSAIICWGSSIRSRDLKNLKLIKKAGSVLGTPGTSGDHCAKKDSS
ncbi:hypothetical protein CHARACLAT_004850 [Characodon lateralis]|uniref:Uncharacterized protein n=1 Tax=Characodon lateralis TaxID=208331 RepID=A0ABU7CLE3_9TELE|nr:hypothetical protein [Characodon lateralis]